MVRKIKPRDYTRLTQKSCGNLCNLVVPTTSYPSRYIGADVPYHLHPSEKINTSTHKPILLHDEIAKPGMALDC